MLDGKVADVVEKWNSSHHDENLLDSQLCEICRGVQDGKGTEDILNGVNESGSAYIKNNLINQIKDIRGEMPTTNLAKRGNMAVAELF